MLAMIDGARDVRAIAAERGRWEFEGAKTLFGLDSAGIVVLADPGPAKRERSSLAADLAELVAQAEDALARRDFEGARAAAEQAAGAHPHDPPIHLLLGRGGLAAGRGPSAVEGLRRTLPLQPHLLRAHRSRGYPHRATRRFADG